MTRNKLLDALAALIKTYPYTEQEVHYKVALTKDAAYAEELFSSVIISSEKNLYYSMQYFYRLQKGTVFPYATILAPFIPKHKNFSVSFMKQCLRSIGRDPKRIKAPTVVPDNCLVFYDALTNSSKNFCILEYVPSYGYYLTKIDTVPLFPMKALSYTYPSKILPDGAAVWLFRLTRGDTILLDRFSEFLARAASPQYNGKNITVLCTKQNQQTLLSLLYEILSPLVPYDDNNKDVKSLPSLNKICRPSMLQKLFTDQETGSGVVFVRQTSLSDAARPVLKKLLAGQPIPIKTRHCPKQYLHNKTHIICFSSDPQKAAQLSKSLKSPLLDFTEKEIPIPYSAAELPSENIRWLRNVFLPHGLLAPSHYEPEKTVNISSSDWVDVFLNDCCEVCHGALSDRQAFYASYCECYQAAHPGKKPPLTCGRFAKVVKQKLSKGPFLQVKYHKVRKYQKMYFEGILCTKKAGDIKASLKESQYDQFLSYLHSINQNRPQWETVYHLIQPKLPESTD